MPRKARIDAPGALHHIIVRGIERRRIFSSDERILGDGDFTQSVLDEAKERLEERCRPQAQGYDLEKVTIRVSSELGIDPEQV